MQRNIVKSGNIIERSTEEWVGNILSNARTGAGFDISDIHQQTKISTTTLLAMEEGRYEDLPDLSFCRGFYRIYAQAIGLDPQKIVAVFQREWDKSSHKKRSIPSSHNEENIDALAGRPSLLVFSSIGAIFLLLTCFTAFLCWFFSWNPASFLSQKLRSLDSTPSFEQTLPPEQPHSDAIPMGYEPVETAQEEPIQPKQPEAKQVDIASFSHQEFELSEKKRLLQKLQRNRKNI